MRKLPQRLVNVRVRDRGALDGATAVWEAVEAESSGLEGRGRVLVRAVRHRAAGPRDGRGARRGRVRGRDRAAWSRSSSAISPERSQRADARSAARTCRSSMCGIVGYTGSRPCREILLAGLEKLEYRGYDSAGISLLTDGEVQTVRAVGNLSHLRDAVGDNGFGNGAVAGIGHTRWATHGRVTEANAHPHDDSSGRVHIVLNGIVENWTRAAPGARGRRRDLQLGDRRRGRRAPDRRPLRRRSRRRRARRLRRAARPLRLRRGPRRRAGPARRRAQGVPAGDRRRRGGELRRLGDPGLPARHAPRAARRERRDRRDHARRARASRPPPASRSSGPPRRSTGTRRPPRRAATRPSCSRRSTSSRTRSPRRSPTAWSATASSSATSASPTTSCATCGGS